MGRVPLVSAPARPSRPACSSAILVLGILVLAAALRMLFLTVQSFWVDEGTSVAIARLPWGDFVRVLAHGETNMAFYYTLLRLWIHLGHDDFAIRTLSVLFSVATVPVVYLLGVRLFGRRAGLAAALLLALNAFHIRYAQEARSYSLVALLVSLASLCFVAGIQRSSGRTWALYAAAMALAVYSHAFAVFVLTGHWVSLACLPRRDVPWKAIVTSSLVIALLVVPFGFMLIAGDHGQVSWIPRPTLATLPGTLAKLAGASDAVPPLRRRLLLVPSIALLAAAVVLAARSWKREAQSEKTWRYAFLLAWLSLPALLAFAVSFVKPILMPHYLIVCVPPLALLLGAALARLRNLRLLAASLVVVMAAAGAEAAYYYGDNEKEDWRGATRYVLSQAGPDDAVVFYAEGKPEFNYYREQWRDPRARTGVAEYALPWDAAILAARHRFDLRILQRLRRSRVWLVLNNDWTSFRTANGPISREPLAQAIQRELARDHVLLSRQGFPGDIRVLLYSPRVGAAAGP